MVLETCPIIKTYLYETTVIFRAKDKIKRKNVKILNDLYDMYAVKNQIL